MTWDDVFKSFDLRHGFLLDKLKYDRDKVSSSIKNETENLRYSADNITLKVVNK